jgi:hypothetical protein
MIKIYRNIILLVILHGYETWSLTLREEHRLSVFENRVLGRMFGRKGVEAIQIRENCTMRSFTICNSHQIFLGGQIKQDDMV